VAEHLQYFAFTFVPLFIVIDALGNLPYVISLSEGMMKQDRGHRGEHDYPRAWSGWYSQCCRLAALSL
jgi:hypothetical protein